MTYDNNDGPIYSVLTNKNSGFLVSGAGSSEVNGTYCQAGTFNGQPYYLRQGGGPPPLHPYVLSFDTTTSPGRWDISSGMGDAFYLNYDGITSGTWQSHLGNGAEPMPTVTATTC